MLITGVSHHPLLPPFRFFLFFLPLPSFFKMKVSEVLGRVASLPAFLYLPVFLQKLDKLGHLKKLGFDNLEVLQFGAYTILFYNNGRGVSL